MGIVGKRVERVCPICASGEKEHVYHNSLASIDDCELGYEVVRCARCAFAFADNVAPAETYQHYYSRYSKYDIIASAAEVPLLSCQMALNASAFLRPYLSPDASIFDIGCSIGVLLGTLKELGFSHLSGVDPGPNSAVTAERLFGVPVATGFLEEGTDLSSFDLVILAAVLEHLTDFHRTLPAAAATLRKGSLLYIEVPAADRFGDLREAEPFGEFSLEHVDFFGAKSLENFFRPLGLEPIAQCHVLYVNGAFGLMMLFRKTGRGMRTAPTPDEPTRRSLESYVACCSARMQEVSGRLQALAGEPVIVYGAGSHTARLLRQSALGDCRILFCADRNPNLHSAALDGIPVLGPDALAEHPGVPIVISSYLYEQEIARQLALAVRNPLVQLYGNKDTARKPLVHKS